MAGGEHATIVPCLYCAGPADRIFEGLEDDHYRCRECHSEFNIDWSYEGPPKSSCWPISEEDAKEIRRMGMGAVLFPNKIFKMACEMVRLNSCKFIKSLPLTSVDRRSKDNKGNKWHSV